MSDRIPNLFSNDEGRLTTLVKSVAGRFEGRPYGVVWITSNALPKSVQFRFPQGLGLKRVLLVFEGLPIAVDSLKTWRRWAIGVGAMDVLVEFAPAGMDEDRVTELFGRRCSKWAEPLPFRESTALTAGSHVTLGAKARGKDHPDLLTMMFGSMGDLLTRVDLIRVRFQMVGAAVRNTKAGYLRTIDKLIGSEDQNSPGKPPEIDAEHLMSHLPRLLLRGETGVGKTLIARYLQEDVDLRPPRISIPEFLGKEDMFEYDLFGYVHGAYTGGKKGGDHGLLLENVGGVVFLDEIGEASAIIQAKLLAYLDDYRIRPRGWRGAPFYCPTLIVAATNRDLKDLAKKGRFRGDLLARFTDVETIPPLRERVESLPFILDCLLQSGAINPDAAVQEIGQEAFAALKKYEFRGNFRELEDTLRTACQAVTKDGRQYICRSDLPF
jgi:hypothetical protein